MKNNPRFQRGFTLVELLVVIVIIAVLGSFSLSMIRRGKQSAVSASTLNNLREIGSAAAGWTGDNNGYIMHAWNNQNGKNESYATLLDPYFTGVDEFRNSQSKFIGPNKRIPVTQRTGMHPITYAMNPAVGVDITDGTTQRIPISKVHNLGEVILLADGCQKPGNGGQSSANAHKLVSVGSMGYASQGSAAIPVGPNEDTDSADGNFRYQWDKCHVLFCDGSSKTLAKGKIVKRNIWYYMQ